MPQIFDLEPNASQNELLRIMHFEVVFARDLIALLMCCTELLK